MQNSPGEWSRKQLEGKQGIKLLNFSLQVLVSQNVYLGVSFQRRKPNMHFVLKLRMFLYIVKQNDSELIIFAQVFNLHHTFYSLLSVYTFSLRSPTTNQHQYSYHIFALFVSENFI